MLKQKEILTILQNYKAFSSYKEDIEAIGVFGSVARNEVTDESDIDICLKTKKADMFAIIHIKEELQTLFKSSVDIVRVREKMNPYLKTRIEKEAIYV